MKVRKTQNLKWMKSAIDEALEGIEANHGGPFGCVIVKEGKIVGKGHNEVLKNNDPTCHGEMQAIRDACKNLGTYDLSGCELYTSAYPCPGCAGFIQWANIKDVYYACNLDDTNEIGFRDDVFYKNPIIPNELARKEGKELFSKYLSLNRDRY